MQNSTFPRRWTRYLTVILFKSSIRPCMVTSTYMNCINVSARPPVTIRGRAVLKAISNWPSPEQWYHNHFTILWFRFQIYENSTMFLIVFFSCVEVLLTFQFFPILYCNFATIMPIHTIYIANFCPEFWISTKINWFPYCLIIRRKLAFGREF